MVINASGRIKFAQYLGIAVGYNTFKYIKNELSCIFRILKQGIKTSPQKHCKYGRMMFIALDCLKIHPLLDKISIEFESHFTHIDILFLSLLEGVSILFLLNMCRILHILHVGVLLARFPCCSIWWDTV
jgi:hypothetical protein